MKENGSVWSHNRFKVQFWRSVYFRSCLEHAVFWHTFTLYWISNMFRALGFRVEVELSLSRSMVWPFLSEMMCGTVKPIDLTWTVCDCLPAITSKWRVMLQRRFYCPKASFFFHRQENVKAIGSSCTALKIHVKIWNGADKSLDVVTIDWSWGSVLLCVINNIL